MNLDNLRQDLADQLFLTIAELDQEPDLASAGLDSVRILTLVETWRAKGLQVDFIELAERTQLTEWLELLQTRIDEARTND
jgi:bifunctional isochorismate lyase/aryl carrier protein